MSIANISLASVLVPTKTAEIDFPGYKNFKLQLCFQSREEMVKLQKKCMRTKIDRKTRQPVEEMDDELFVELYVEAILKGWSGLKMKYVAQLMPIDASKYDLEDELAFTNENALVLMKNSVEFDSFVTETVRDLQNFTTASSK